MLFDAHMHLSDEYNALDECKAKEIIENAKNNNINYLISNSTCLRSIDENIYLAKKDETVLLGLGIFPTEFKTEKDLEQINIIKDKIKELKEKNLENKIVIGEIGLDFKDDNSNKEIQEKAFIEQLKIAKENNIYAEIHSRYAVKQVMKILEEFDYNKIIMHWFTDSKKYIDKAIKKGYFITIGPKYLYDSIVIENIKDVPKEQLLFETDYPANVSGKEHLPESINDLLNKYCKDFEIKKDDMQITLEKSFKKIFPNL